MCPYDILSLCFCRLDEANIEKDALSERLMKIEDKLRAEEEHGRQVSEWMLLLNVKCRFSSESLADAQTGRVSISSKEQFALRRSSSLTLCLLVYATNDFLVLRGRNLALSMLCNATPQ